MACNDPCNNNPIHYPKRFSYSTTASSNCGCTDASNIIYTGVDLPCSSISSNTNLEEVLKLMDAKICQATGDYSTYDIHCLSTDYTVNTEAEFVSAITEYACDLNTKLNTFTGTTYPAGLAGLQTQITALVNPNLTLCSYSGIISSDTQNGINTKLANKLCDLNSRLDISSVVWNNCYTVVTPPATIPAALQLLSDQICQAATTGSSVTLPTFNNQGSCLPAPLGTADTLVSTINKIKTRLCQSAIYDINTSPWGCIPNPASGTGANIQAAFDATLSTVNSLYGSRYTFDGSQFNLTQNTTGDTCSGFTVTLDPSVGISDNKVGATLSDTNPSYLQDKLVEGDNITFDYSDPEKVAISSSFTDENVKVSNTDTAGFLEDKIIEGTDEYGIGIRVNNIADQLVISPSIEIVNLAQQVMLAIQDNILLYNQFCQLSCGCAPCNDSTTTLAPSSTLRLYFDNQSTTDDVDINVIINQNNPTVSFENVGYNIAANGATSTGYHPLTTITSPKTVSLNLVNPNKQTYDIKVEVRLGSSGGIIMGSSTYSATNFSSYLNSTFNIGSVSGDIVIKVIFTNVTTV